MPNIATSAAQFDPAWWAAQPSAVRVYENQPVTIANLGARQTALLALGKEGYIIDPVILLYGWDPFYRMTYSEECGYTWAPSIVMPPVSLAPGLKQGSAAPYDPTMIPPGAIIITLDLDLLPTLFPAPGGAK